MFFISFGTVAVFTNRGKELCHLSDGSYFGEIAVMMENQKRAANVIAVDSCELFELSRQDFFKSIEAYPEYCQRLKALAEQRMRTTGSFSQENNDYM